MFGFDNVPESKSYLRTAGLQQNATFVALTYVPNEAWEAFDIEFLCENGETFIERTFGPDKDKVYPKAVYDKVTKVACGMETQQEAFDRVCNEISNKLFYLAACFIDRNELKERIKNCRDFRELVNKVSSIIESCENKPTINFLTIWKNNTNKQKSNLIIAERIKWCEATKLNEAGAVMPATIKLTAYQKDNQLVEKYPYQGKNEPAAQNATSAEDLPF